jgi:2-polyprenyl-3-methyl-5-hydroxy-6-metoxy-1,4-benzoquinol methylase
MFSYLNKELLMTKEICPVCQSELFVGYQSWHLLCKNCRYEKSNLHPTINLNSAHKLIDENSRENGLRKLRIKNFKTLLTSIKSLKPSGGCLLDVGSAHGWFLDTAKNDFDVLGLDPDRNLFNAAFHRGLPVRMGYFPDALDVSEKFDVIVFNDVIEHIPDIERILACCHQRLNKDGLLVLNLPSSNGVFYRLSKIICRLGFPGFFERLWQKDLPSPHLHYFELSNLIDLLKSNGFYTKIKGSLPTLSLTGLYTRVSYTGNLSIVARIFICVSVAIFLPILKILPGDIVHVVSIRK